MFFDWLDSLPLRTLATRATRPGLGRAFGQLGLVFDKNLVNAA
jgi:hypothetical protein